MLQVWLPLAVLCALLSVLTGAPAGASFLSPDGQRLAWPALGYDRDLEEITGLMVAAPDGAGIRLVASFPGHWREISWLGNDRLLADGAVENRTLVLTLSGAREPDIEIPARYHPFYKVVSPNGRLLAFVGYEDKPDPTGGLYLLDLGSGKVRCLIPKALKTAPAWSPDSARLAISSVPGYVRLHSLALVDVSTGQITDTGLEGSGAAWSPDGKRLAFVTQVAQGGGWHEGIPTDGRIAIWEVGTRSVRYASPPPHNRYEDDTGAEHRFGSLEPVWSPDGRWLAHRRETYTREGKDLPKSDHSEIWITDAQGGSARKVAEGAGEVAFSSDGKALFTCERGEIARTDLTAGTRTVLVPKPTATIPEVAEAKPLLVRTPGGGEVPVSVGVDLRIELLSIIFRLSGSREYCMGRVPAYLEDLDRHFAPQRGHPVVACASRLRAERGVSFNAPPSLAVHLKDAVGLEGRLPLDPRPEEIDSRWGTAELAEFLNLARQFVQQADVPRFFREHERLYRFTAARAASAMRKHGHLEWFGEFFGARPPSDFKLVLALVNGPCCYSARFRAGGTDEMYCVLGVWQCDGNGLPRIDADCMPTVVHEFGHCFSNPVAAKCQPGLEAAARAEWEQVKESMGRQAYGSWESMIGESLVRACVARYRLKYEGEQAAAREVQEQEQADFHWVRPMYEALAEYEADRSRYPTLESFAPRLVARVREWAAKHSAALPLRERGERAGGRSP